MSNARIVCINGCGELWPSNLIDFVAFFGFRSFRQQQLDGDECVISVVLLYFDQWSELSAYTVLEVRQQIKSCPLVVAVRKMDSETLLACLRLGVDDYCVLPNEQA
ncbi:MAG: hypothetical protein OEZ58_18380 [Gammaproteobacteria bacterium]|nr:hypothetical protein [Gammaproteobacteria bacterium]MDH5730959.1 hypothetical protein [Gammaproteobacteria bacterium]